MSVNYFESKPAAERFALGRPYFHPLVTDHIRAFLSLEGRLARGIDVGCGTGLSAMALTDLAKEVVGIDKSAEMIGQAMRVPSIEYRVGPAEEMPVEDSDFDLMTLSSVFHWLDRPRFFAEARRVLRPGAWLVIYDNAFTARGGNPAHYDWQHEVFLKRYPSPPRDGADLSDEDAAREGFRLAERQDYENFVGFTVEELVDYLVTQTNVVTAVEGGSESLTDVKTWLDMQIRPMYERRARETFMFRGPIWYLQRSAGP